MKTILILGGYGQTGRLLAHHLLGETDCQFILDRRRPAWRVRITFLPPTRTAVISSSRTLSAAMASANPSASVEEPRLKSGMGVFIAQSGDRDNPHAPLMTGGTGGAPTIVLSSL